MTNREFYKNDMIDLAKNGQLCNKFTSKKILPFYNTCCNDITCRECDTLKAFWLEEEYKESEVDWSKVAVDTPILVRDNDSGPWRKRHFAKSKDGYVFAWEDGGTSFTATNSIIWDCAKLYKEGESYNE